MLKGILGKIRLPAFAQIDLKNTTIKIKDGGSNSIEVTIGEGNLTWSEKKNMEYVLNRGNLDEVREGDQVPVDLSFDFIWEYITGGPSTTTVVSVEDALKKTNGASAWVSSDAGDLCRPYAVDIEVEHNPTCGGGDTETLTFADFRYEQLDHDLRNASVACSGRCNITMPAVVRA